MATEPQTYIYRTITTTMCNGQHIDDHGEFADFTDIILKNVTPQEATRILRTRHNDQSVTINNVETETRRYRMSITQYIAYAEDITEGETK